MSLQEVLEQEIDRTTKLMSFVLESESFSEEKMPDIFRKRKLLENSARLCAVEIWTEEMKKRLTEKYGEDFIEKYNIMKKSLEIIG